MRDWWGPLFGVIRGGDGSGEGGWYSCSGIGGVVGVVVVI